MTGAADVQAVVFELGGETFALPVCTVCEILDYRPAFRMPQGPAWLSGLIQVRGGAMPMLDLRVRLGLPPATIGMATRVLVVDVAAGERRPTLGLIVDHVIEVATFASGTVETTPDIGVRWNSDYIDGVVRREAGFVVLLDPAVLFAQPGDALASMAMDAAA